MLFRVTVGFVLVISAVVAKAQTAFSSQADSSTEQIETGRIHLPGHNDVIYRIRLLPVAAFPALPQPIAALLNDRHCLIPQTYEARRPENVIRGSFEKQGSDDWAALCSVNGTTTLYVFFQSQTGTPHRAPSAAQHRLAGCGNRWSLRLGLGNRLAPSFAHPRRQVRSTPPTPRPRRHRRQQH